MLKQWTHKLIVGDFSCLSTYSHFSVTERRTRARQECLKGVEDTIIWGDLVSFLVLSAGPPASSESTYDVLL